MGQGYGSGLRAVQQRACDRAGKLHVTGRYHRLPRSLEEDYILDKEVLGRGSNGEVRVARSKRDPYRRFAVKLFKLTGVSEEARGDLENEAEIFLGMDHPHVGRLVDVYESPARLDLVMECMTGGELFARVSARKRFSEKDAAQAVWQMLLAINYLHQHGVVHRDVKLENFLYETTDNEHLKLIDFGFSKIWEPNTNMALSCGTLSYVAPEVLKSSYTSKCDMWSLGVIAFVLLIGHLPFAGSQSQQLHLINHGKFQTKKETWHRLSDFPKDFISKLLVVDPEARMSAGEALAHPWISSRDQHSDTVDKEVVKALCSFSQVSCFRRACLNVMAWSLTAEERAQVRDIFISMDKSKTGTITMWDFKRVLQEQDIVIDESAYSAFQALDTSHDEEIHYSEFLAAMVASRIKLHDDLLRETFRRFDTDNSGYITADNLRQVLGQTFEGAECESLIREADISSDGKISLEEFMFYLRGDLEDTHALAVTKVIDTQMRNSQRETIVSKISPPLRLEGPAPEFGCCVGCSTAKDTPRGGGRCGCALQ